MWGKKDFLFPVTFQFTFHCFTNQFSGCTVMRSGAFSLCVRMISSESDRTFHRSFYYRYFNITFEVCIYNKK